MTSDTSTQPQSRGGRPWMWLTVGWTIAAIVLGALVLISVRDTCGSMTGLGQSLCQTNATIGSVLGVLAVFAIWLLGTALLALGWVAARPAQRLCPPFGHAVDEGSRACPQCGYDFILGQLPPEPRMAPPASPVVPTPGAQSPPPAKVSRVP